MRKKRHPLRNLLFFLIVVAAVFFGSNLVMKQMYPKQYEDLVEQYAKQQQLEPELVYAVIKCESGFDPQAVSSVDAKGLMQLTDATFDWLQSKTHEAMDATALFDPETNIRYGTMLLRMHLDEFGDLSLALAAYHAGRGRVNQWIDEAEESGNSQAIQYKDTQGYVSKVTEAKKIYETLY